MKKKLSIILALGIYAMPLFTQSDLFYPVHGIPDSLLLFANEVVREENTIFKVESLRAGTFDYRKVVTILNSSSKANQTVVFYDDDSSIRRFRANLYDAEGHLIRKVDKDEIKDYSAVADFSIYQDDRVQVLEVEHSRYPYTIEVEYEMRLSGHRFCNFPAWNIQRFGTAVEKGLFSLQLPKDLTFFYQVLNMKLEPEKVQEGNRNIYTWRVDHLKALQQESQMPPGTQILPMVITAPGDFQWDQYQGSMASWEAYGRFMSNLFADRDRLPVEAAQQARQITAGTEDVREKIRRLYRHLQKNTRYVSVQLGIGGWQPFDAGYVYEKRYGDCKALSNYMKAMLKEVGIEAFPALIYNGDLDYEVQEGFTTPRFNHMILYIPEEDLWLECTSSSFPPGYIGQGNSNRNALLITREGGQLKKTPVYGYEDNTETHLARIDLDENGQASVQVKSRYSGGDHEIYRSIKHQLSEEDQKKWFLKKQTVAGFRLETYYLDCDTQSPASQLSFSASIVHFAQKAGSRLFVPVRPITPSVSIPPNNDHRRYPIHISRSYSERDTVILRFPEGYHIESSPEIHQEFKTDFGFYQYNIEIQDSQLTYVRELSIQEGQLPAEGYNDYRNFFKAIAKADGGQIVLKKSD